MQAVPGADHLPITLALTGAQKNIVASTSLHTMDQRYSRLSRFEEDLEKARAVWADILPTDKSKEENDQRKSQRHAMYADK